MKGDPIDAGANRMTMNKPLSNTPPSMLASPLHRTYFEDDVVISCHLPTPGAPGSIELVWEQDHSL